MKTYCIYHKVDFDGKCGAAIILRKYPDAELVPYNYGDDIDLETFAGAHVIMVDCSLQPFQQMLELSRRVSRLTWIDHHKTAIEEYEKLPAEACDDPGCPCRKNIDAHLDPERAGCEIAWNWAFPDLFVPPVVHLLGRYDVLDLEASKDVLPMQWGMRQFDGQPDWERWPQLFMDEGEIGGLVDIIIEQGKTILAYVKSWNMNACRSAFPAELDGLKCICLTMPRANSQVFESVWDPEKYDAMLAFHRSAKHWTVTLYTDKPGIDVGAVAKARGGGGHLQAAGFRATELPKVLGHFGNESSEVKDGY